MSRISLIIGVALSFVLHAALLLLGRSGQAAAAPPAHAVPAPARVVLAEMLAAAPEPPAKAPEPGREAAPDPMPAPAADLEAASLPGVARREPEPPRVPALSREVVAPSPAAPEPAAGGPGPAPLTPDPEALPALRITWSSTDQLRSVARDLAMKVVAVDGRSEVVGEVTLSGELRLVPFAGRFADYSNRVRTLPRSLFASRIVTGDASVTAYWILVPTGLDRQIADTVRAALAERSLAGGGVDWIEAEFRPSPAGPALVITRIET